jgi:hypothetical protein
MTRLTVQFPQPAPATLTTAPGLSLAFPAPQAVTLQVQGIQGGGGGGGATDLGYVAATRTLTSSTGDDVVLPLADGTNAGLMSSASVLELSTALQPGALIPWNDVTGKPSTFPPSTHSHVAADVTDFASAARGVALTGYAASGSRLALVATDTILGAFNKLGKWVADLAAVAFSGSASDLTAGTLPAARFDDTAHGTRAGGTLHPAATTSVAGFMSGADKTKLDGVATGATANATDAALRDRATHTGTQLAITISDFATAVAATPAVTANTAKVTNATHTGDASGATVLTLATVNTNVGTFGLAGSVAQFTVNAKGLITSAVNVAISIAATAISDSTAAGRAMLTAATAAAQTALLNTFTTTLKGLVPPPGSATGLFLRDDGTWAAAGGGSPVTVQDEGTNITTALSTLNFVGAGVTVTGGATATVTIPGGGGGGDVVGPASATDNAIARFDSTTGKLIQNSAVTVSDAGALTLPSIAVPAAPAAGLLTIFAQSRANRKLPAFIGPSGLDTTLQPAIFANRVAVITPQRTTGMNVWGCGIQTGATLSHVAPGTASMADSMLRTRFTTTAVAGNNSNVRSNGFCVRGNGTTGRGGFFFAARFCTGSIALAGGQFFVGLQGSENALAGEPSALTNLICVGKDIADTNMFFMHNDGAGTATRISTGEAYGVNKALQMRVFCPPSSSEIWYLVERINDDGTLTTLLDGSFTTDLVVANSALSMHCQIRNGATAAAANIDLVQMYCETDF